MDLNAYGVMENMNQKKDPEEWIDRLADEVQEKRLQETQVLEKPEGQRRGYQLPDNTQCV